MQGPRVDYQVNPRFVPDDVPVWLGTAKDAALIFDNANNEFTIQTKNVAGTLTDRLRIKANVDTATFEIIGNLNSLAITAATGNSLVVDTNVLVVDATNNRVGIGTAAPAYHLHVSTGGAGVPSIAIEDTTRPANLKKWRLVLSDLVEGDFEIEQMNDNDTVKARVLYLGGVDLNIGLNVSAQFGGGAKVVGLANAATVPTTNPTGGVVIYAEAGALKARGSSGTVTTIALA